MVVRRGDQISVPCVFMRGGSSRGAVFHASDIPRNRQARDRLVLAAFGSPDIRQIDGLGGADPLTSKVAVVDRSTRPDADVDYLFGQVSITTPEVFWVGNCGNMIAAVAAFAVDEGLVEVVEPVTRVRIFAVNVGQVVTAEVPVANGVARVSGDATVAGVPGTGAPIMLDFGDCAGAVTGRLLPTGQPLDIVEVPGIGNLEVSVVDAATPFVYLRARDLGVDPEISPNEMLADGVLLEQLETVRAQAAVLCRLVGAASRAALESPSIPRVTMVGRSPEPYRAGESPDVLCRQMSMQQPHRAYAVTNGVCTAVAASVPGTVVHQMVRTTGTPGLRIGHPGGIMVADAEVVPTTDGDGYRIRRASIARTARAILRGQLLIKSELLITQHSLAHHDVPQS